MKRAMAAVAVLALSTLIPLTPVRAVESFHGTAKGAVAEWWSTDGDDLTGVMIEVVNRAEHTPQGAVVRTVGLDLQVIQQGTDLVSGEPFYRQYWTDPFYAPMSELNIHTLSSASAHGSVTLLGMEWVGDEERSIGPSTVTVNADWMVAGAVTRDWSNLWDTQFGAKSLETSALRSAPATASARVTGDLPLGNLGKTTGELVAVRISQHLQPGPMPPPEFQAAWRLPGIMDTDMTGGFEHLTGAFGLWQVGGEDGTHVMLDVARAHGRSDTGTTPTGTLEMFGSYCDAATDEWVSYDVFSGPVDLGVARIPASLSAGSVVFTASLTGYESRMADCDDPSGEPVDQEGGPYLVTIRASWTGTGAIEHYRSLHFVRGPDYSVRGVELASASMSPLQMTVGSSLRSASARICCRTSQPCSSSRPRRRSMISPSGSAARTNSTALSRSPSMTVTAKRWSWRMSAITSKNCGLSLTTTICVCSATSSLPLWRRQHILATR